MDYKEMITQLEKEAKQHGEEFMSCEWNKRKKCDSFYFVENIELEKMNKRLNKENKELKEEITGLRTTLRIYDEKFNELNK